MCCLHHFLSHNAPIGGRACSGLPHLSRINIPVPSALTFIRAFYPETSNMATQNEGGGKDEIKTQFMTREGTYKLMPLSEYSRPNRVPYNGQGNTPVKVSFITLNDQSGSTDRICFNIGRELYFYHYKGVRKVCKLLISIPNSESTTRVTFIITYCHENFHKITLIYLIISKWI